jgi:hypothetical protein
MSDPVDDPDAKVLFRVPYDDGTAEVETLWATRLGGDRYRLDNCPFYAYSVSWEDIVLAPWSEEENLPVFERVLEKSGNRTVRVIFKPPLEAGNESDRILQGLIDRGCSCERATHSYVSINIPPGVELEVITAYLADCDANWESADPSYDELYPDAE